MTIPPPERLEANYRNLDRVNGWISNAEGKAGGVFGVAGILLGLVVSRLPDAIIRIREISVSLRYLSDLSLVLAAILLVLSTYRSLIVYYPKLDAPAVSPFYFGSIARMALDDFSARMKQMDEAKIEEELIQQTHVNAGIALRKFENTRGAIRLLIAASVLLILHLVLDGVTKMAGGTG